jgi:D-alanyl-D-alanine carboxypeptidase (penicillin-binding protein 5/6)
MAARRPLLHVLVALVLAVAAGPVAAQTTPPTVPPPTPVPPLGSPSPYPTGLETPPPSTTPPRVEAASAALSDLDSGRVLWAQGGAERRPIASVTKIMTALLVLESLRPGERVVASPLAASQTGAELGLRTGEEIPISDLLLALMLQSANDAAVALAEHVGGSVEGFVDRMNQRAEELKLRDTRFSSPNGLDDSGYSSARDLTALTAEAYRHPRFAAVVATKFHRIRAPAGPSREIQNRNALLWLYPGGMGVKTGYTAAAGFCLVATAERDGLRLAAVVLGAPEQAFAEAAEVLNHGFATYERRTVISAGQEVEPITVDGQEIPVEAGGSVSILVRRDAQVELDVEPQVGLALPITAGQAVGRVTAVSPVGETGDAPLIARQSVDPTPVAAPRPKRSLWDRWWEAAAGVVVQLLGDLLG